jgi:small subunit ribosomal protein S5
VGYGLGKANEVTDAITKGIDDAKKHLVKVPSLKELFPRVNRKVRWWIRIVEACFSWYWCYRGGAMRACLKVPVFITYWQNQKDLQIRTTW